MAAGESDEPAPRGKETAIERRSERDLFVTRTFDAPAHIVFAAWTKPEQFKQWWALKSTGMTIIACDMDVRAGGVYRLEFGHPDFDQPIVFHGKYIEVVPNARLVWTNEESEQGAVTTLTFVEDAGRTLLTLHERHPSKQALDEALEGMESCATEQYAQLDDLLKSMGS